MNPTNAFNLIVQVILTRSSGTSVEIDSWKQALQELQKVIQPITEDKPEEPKEVV